MVAWCLCSSPAVAREDGLKNLLDAQHQHAAQLSGSLRSLPLHPGEMLMPAGQNPAMQQLVGVKTVVFLSRAMPEAELLKLLAQGAGRNDTVFLYRGWGSSGVDTAFDYAEHLVRRLPESARRNPPNIMVMPQAFRQYRIGYVPAMLHLNGGKWYMVQGVPDLDTALQAIGRKTFNRRLSRQWRVSEPDQTEVMRTAATRFDWHAHARQTVQALNRQMAGSMDLPVATKISNRLVIPYVAASYDIRHPATGAVVYPKGTRFNVLALDPAGHRSILVIDGRDARQVRYAQRIIRERPQTVLFYTRLGALVNAGLSASPLTPPLAQRLSIRVVPTYIQQQGTAWRMISVPPFD